MTLSLNRRQLLRTALMGATALSVGGCLTAPPPVPPVALKRLIDPHVHVFNGADLPVRGFATLVLQQSRTITALFTGFARTARRADLEIADLRAALGGTPLTTADARSDEQILGDYLQSVAETAGQGQLQPGAAEGTVSASEAALRLQGLRDLTTAFVPQAREARVTTTGAAARLLADKAAAEALARAILNAPETGSGTADALNPGVVDPCDGGEARFGNLGTVFRWATLLTRPRAQILDTLHDVFGAQDAAQFVTPALVDFGLWVDDADTTPLSQQLDVNALLFRRANARGTAVHGFAAFDPWRHALLQASGQTDGLLAWLKHAIGEAGDGTVAGRAGLGFIGVKLYPPMGFRPLGNADLAAGQFPPKLRQLAASHGKPPGRMLDDAMSELFAWCAAEDVPVMAHCSASNFPHVSWASTPPGMRSADPAHWRRVLERWPSLRLNLAHSGGLMIAECARATGSLGWLDAVYALCDDPAYPNVYADVGDFTEIFAQGRSDEADAITTRIGDALAGHAGAAGRILYGSDWIMQARLRGHQAYLTAMHDRFVPALAARLGSPPDFEDRFFWRNAQAFLGLQRGSRTLRRLMPFYGEWNGLPPLDRDVLDRFVA